MVTLTLAIAAVIGATIAIFVDRNIQAKKKLAKEQEKEPQAASAEAVEPEAGKAAGQPGRVSQYVTSVRHRLMGNKQEIGKKLQALINANVDDAELQAWMNDLSPEAATALAEQLADFCFTLGMELHWLFADSLERDPEIKKAAIAVVIAYCEACWRGAQGYRDFELFKLIQELEQAPFARKRQDLSRRLFTELVARDMAASVPTALFLASEKERQEHMATAIQQAATGDREAFKTTLKDVLAAQETAAEAEAEPHQLPAEQAEAAATKQRRFFGKKSKEQPATAAPSEVATEPEPAAS